MLVPQIWIWLVVLPKGWSEVDLFSLVCVCSCFLQFQLSCLCSVWFPMQGNCDESSESYIKSQLVFKRVVRPSRMLERRIYGITSIRWLKAALGITSWSSPRAHIDRKVWQGTCWEEICWRWKWNILRRSCSGNQVCLPGFGMNIMSFI